MHKNILISGVGGQGTLLASRIIGQVATMSGFHVKISEVHGMSQRGGSVVTYVKYADEEVCSPIIDLGGADIILAFERLEAYRYIPYIKQNGKLIVNATRIDPMPVITGAMAYPENILEKIKNMSIDMTSLDALQLAKEAGNQKAVNVVLIGLLASTLDIDKTIWIEALCELVPPKFLELNKRAFEAGYEEGRKGRMEAHE